MSRRTGGPIRLLDESRRILSSDECDAIAKRVRSFARGGGTSLVRISSWWNGEMRWARNRVSLAGDRRESMVTISRRLSGGSAQVTTNQLDDASFEAAMRTVERAARYGRRVRPDATLDAAPNADAANADAENAKAQTDEEVNDATEANAALVPPKFEYPKTAIWSEATHGLPVAERAGVARALVEPAEAAGMLSAGYLEVRASATALLREGSEAVYGSCTQAQCSTTVRDPKGTGSGWAGLSSYDWAAIDGSALGERALQKCLASRNPVALEPGRYTVILEAQAVADLVGVMSGRSTAEDGRGPYALAFNQALGLWRSKLGLKVVDERITISHDPSDPALGVVPFVYSTGEPYRAVTWIDRGVLTNLVTDRHYALVKLNDNLGYPLSGAFRVSGGDTSVDEMIATTKRGLLVTRFSNVRQLDGRSLLSTGLTRDGLWLIENGKISKAVKNFRFTESPLFVLNSIEQLGVPVPVFNPVRSLGFAALEPRIVPPLKARDFSFTSMIDAV